jgi:hypothetical protein
VDVVDLVVGNEQVIESIQEQLAHRVVFDPPAKTGGDGDFKSGAVAVLVVLLRLAHLLHEDLARAFRHILEGPKLHLHALHVDHLSRVLHLAFLAIGLSLLQLTSVEFQLHLQQFDLLGLDGDPTDDPVDDRLDHLVLLLADGHRVDREHLGLERSSGFSGAKHFEQWTDDRNETHLGRVLHFAFPGKILEGIGVRVSSEDVVTEQVSTSVVRAEVPAVYNGVGALFGPLEPLFARVEDLGQFVVHDR